MRVSGLMECVNFKVSVSEYGLSYLFSLFIACVFWPSLSLPNSHELVLYFKKKLQRGYDYINKLFSILLSSVK